LGSGELTRSGRKHEEVMVEQKINKNSELLCNFMRLSLCKKHLNSSVKLRVFHKIVNLEAMDMV